MPFPLILSTSAYNHIKQTHRRISSHVVETTPDAGPNFRLPPTRRGRRSEEIGDMQAGSLQGSGSGIARVCPYGDLLLYLRDGTATGDRHWSPPCLQYIVWARYIAALLNLAQLAWFSNPSVFDSSVVGMYLLQYVHVSKLSRRTPRTANMYTDAFPGLAPRTRKASTREK